MIPHRSEGWEQLTSTFMECLAHTAWCSCWTLKLATTEGSSQVRVLSWNVAGESQAKLLLLHLGLLRELNGARMAFVPGNREIKRPNNVTPSPPGSSKMVLVHMQWLYFTFLYPRVEGWMKIVRCLCHLSSTATCLEKPDPCLHIEWWHLQGTYRPHDSQSPFCPFSLHNVIWPTLHLNLSLLGWNTGITMPIL